VNYDINDDQREMYEDVGYDLIAQGKVALILNVSGMGNKLQLGSPKCLHPLAWFDNKSLLEYYITRVRALGDAALSKHGKKYTKSRAPILLFVMANDKNVQQIDDALVKNNYYGYHGIICFSSVLNPFYTNNLESDAQPHSKWKDCFQREGSNQLLFKRIWRVLQFSYKGWFIECNQRRRG